MNESYFFAWILANDQWNHSNLKQKYPPEVFYKKKLHEKVSQCSQENTYVEVSSIKFRSVGLLTQIFSWLQHKRLPVNIAKY